MFWKMIWARDGALERRAAKGMCGLAEEVEPKQTTTGLAAQPLAARPVGESPFGPQIFLLPLSGIALVW